MRAVGDASLQARYRNAHACTTQSVVRAALVVEAARDQVHREHHDDDRCRCHEPGRHEANASATPLPIDEGRNESEIGYAGPCWSVHVGIGPRGRALQAERPGILGAPEGISAVLRLRELRDERGDRALMPSRRSLFVRLPARRGLVPP